MKFIRSQYYTRCPYCRTIYKEVKVPIRDDTGKRFNPKKTSFPCRCGTFCDCVPVYKVLHIGKRIKIRLY